MTLQFETFESCGKQTLYGGRCYNESCHWMDPEYHSDTCMCILCIPTEKSDASDAEEADPIRSVGQWGLPAEDR